jgi:tRNA dimethylallyltransferase
MSAQLPIDATSGYNLLVIMGPTAGGKTSIAAQVASIIGGEIISADSRQVYRGLTIGTGKDYDDYLVNGMRVPYHLIDIVDAGTQYNVFEFQKNFFQTYANVRERGKFPVLCGGTGMYIEAVTEGYKLIQVPVNVSLRNELETKSLHELAQILLSYKNMHNQSDIDTTKRAIRAIEIADYYSKQAIPDIQFPIIKPLYVGIRYNRAIQRERITQRLAQRLESGLIAEVEHLLQNGLSANQLIYYGLEYKYVTQFVVGQISFDEMFKLLNTAIHQFAKRQMTWFRRMEKQATQINWLDECESNAAMVQAIVNMHTTKAEQKC